MKTYCILTYNSWKNTGASIWEIAGMILIFSFRILVILTLFHWLAHEYGTAIFQDPSQLSLISWGLIGTQIIACSRPRAQLAREIQEDLRSGKIAHYLMLPLSYIGLQIANQFGIALKWVLYFFPVGLIIGMGFNLSLPTHPLVLGASILLLLSSLFVSVMGVCTLSSFGLLISDIAPFMWIYSKLDMFLGGNILPVSLMPLWLVSIASASPFFHSGYSIGGFISHPSVLGLGWILMIQGIWILIFILTIKSIHARIQKYLLIHG